MVKIHIVNVKRSAAAMIRECSIESTDFSTGQYLTVSRIGK
jgi:hypothetical protein